MRIFNGMQKYCWYNGKFLKGVEIKSISEIRSVLLDTTLYIK